MLAHHDKPEGPSRDEIIEADEGRGDDPDGRDAPID